MSDYQLLDDRRETAFMDFFYTFMISRSEMWNGMNTSNTLADKLKKLRKMAGLTQEEVGKKINITRQGYQYYETGVREPDITRLKKLAELYHVSLVDLTSENIHIKREDFLGESPIYTHQGIEMEEQLIQKFRKLSQEQKEKIIRAIDTMVRTR